MFALHDHEHSPRVTLLQILLKDEYNLKVDGVFGPKTRAAVAAFQKSRGEFGGGMPTPTTWNELFRGTNLTVVSSIDAGDPELARDDGQALLAAGDKPILLGAMCNGLGQMVSEVGARATGKSIAALRLDGHGNLGRWLTISVGNVVDMNRRDYRATAKEYYSYIDPVHFAKVAPLLGQLSRQFASFGFAEHHGCSLGTKPQTRAMLAKLVALWGVPISVGTALQPFGVVTYFQGPVVTIFPRGMNLHTWSRQFQNVVVRNMSLAPTSSVFGR
jgi:hypothetical protein